MVTAKKILCFSELAQGNPGSSFRHMQVTILVFGLEKQCGFVLHFGRYSYEVFNDGKCKPAEMIPTLPEGQTPIYITWVASGPGPDSLALGGYWSGTELLGAN